ncbi:type II toxin-antitoxin system HicB family antitoxin [Propylenella binzhouense]|uniref:Type II toxin-antitoxin system HicB family antitoxin n=1 Tax=Propylenella binzhouense TaxID=2555902 RepID=A0A964T7A4_9HYPH|nr:type II toxin-antitoxin system HicB family antitoxin [Propylenella binzhouense]MYZ49856.1 type II toxin-antitoxin system HicB family antitoxin [Propylenella binzhouense]
MSDWTYGIAIGREGLDYVVSVRDLPEVVTSGSNLQEALDLAADAIEVAVAGRMDDDMALPRPSPLQEGEHAILLSAPIAAKASVYSAWKTAGLTKTELARRLNRNEAEIRRLLNPRHGTKLDQLDEAARALGGRLSVTFEEQ